MVSLTVLFWMYVFMFAIIGGLRGWAKEILVSFSIILALTLSTLLSNYVPFIREQLQQDSKVLYFWLRTGILLLMVFFGYEAPNIERIGAKMTRDRLEHVILGIFIGAINGYLIAGTLWSYMASAEYPFASLVNAPTGDLARLAEKYLASMPPKLLGVPGIYFAVVLCFIFVIVVFI